MKSLSTIPLPRSICSVLLLLTLLSYGARAQDTQPNVILIYADDLGRGLLGTYGQNIITTPNIDRLASEGMRFERAYGGNYCAPARMSLLTGRHDCRGEAWQRITQAGIYEELDVTLSFAEIQQRIEAVATPAPADEVFLAQVAQQAGYRTAEFGKLEWGFATTPARLDRHGWDHHFGYYDHQRCHGFYPPFLFENGKKVDIPGNTHVNSGKTRESDSEAAYRERWDFTGKAVYSENLIMEKLLAFLDDNHPQETGQPFFLFFPTQLPHGPIMVPEVHPDFRNDDRLNPLEKEYATMVKMLDDDVGRIHRKLEEMDQLDNTIIVFTSDNGHEIYYASAGRTTKGNTDLAGHRFDNVTTKFYSHAIGDVFDGNDGMAGHKRSNWEGGSRVPLFWYWKGRIAPGSVNTDLVSNYDFLNTLADIVGQSPPAGKDGLSYARALFGEASETHDYLVIASTMGPSLVTREGWKLRHHIPSDQFQLYYLPEDYEERHDRAGTQVQRLAQLKAILERECGGDLRNGLGPQVLPPGR